MRWRPFTYWLEPSNFSSAVCVSACPHLAGSLICDYLYESAPLDTQRVQLDHRCWGSIRTRPFFQLCVPTDAAHMGAIDATLGAQVGREASFDLIQSTDALLRAWTAAALSGLSLRLGLIFLPLTSLTLTVLTALVVALTHAMLLVPRGTLALASARLLAGRNVAVPTRVWSLARHELTLGWLSLFAGLLLLLTLLARVRYAPLAASVLSASAQLLRRSAGFFFLPCYVAAVLYAVWLGGISVMPHLSAVDAGRETTGAAVGVIDAAINGAITHLSAVGDEAAGARVLSILAQSDAGGAAGTAADSTAWPHPDMEGKSEALAWSLAARSCALAAEQLDAALSHLSHAWQPLAWLPFLSQHLQLLLLLPLNFLTQLVLAWEFLTVAGAVSVAYTAERDTGARGEPPKKAWPILSSGGQAVFRHGSSLVAAAVFLPLAATLRLLLPPVEVLRGQRSGCVGATQRALHAAQTACAWASPGALAHLALRDSAEIPQGENGLKPSKRSQRPRIGLVDAAVASEDLYEATPARLRHVSSYTHFFCLLAKTSVALACGIGIWSRLAAADGPPMLFPLWPASVAALGGYALAAAAITVPESAVEAILQCWAKELLYEKQRQEKESTSCGHEA